MLSLQVEINTIEKVRDFAILNNMSSCTVDVLHGRYVVDGKSLLGLFSIPLTHPLTVKLEGSSEDCSTLVKEYKEKGLCIT